METSNTADELHYDQNILKCGDYKGHITDHRA